ncbi:hypothetical protein Taro_053267 [Colocasia esculenta]|uniref:Acetyltransferase n=1 Tax=Colocasia esculenta TaxID=4460 RepID=A0A843XKS1_COLES|nr:hypothetical protein [Colocasia esculenta]
MPSTAPVIRVVSRCIVKPHPGAAGNDGAPVAHPRRCELSLWDLSMFSAHYIQKGHLFSLPSHSTPHIDNVLDRLKTSLSVAIWHFYPLAGRLATELDTDGEGMYVHIDCNDQGAEFTHAAADGVTVDDVLAPSDDVPGFVRRFFPLEGALNYDGLTLPLLAVQVTELADGIFLGCSFNHAVGDGTSFWNFFNAWAEIARSMEDRSSPRRISRPPVHDRWFVDGKFPIKLPFTQEGQFVERFTPPLLREKMFHFTAQSIAGLKARANAEGSTDKISSFQALSALMWRCITRLRRFPDEQRTSCRLAAENRGRLKPPLAPDYFGNSIYPIPTTTTAGELLAHDLGWAAVLLNQCVTSHTDAAIRGKIERWMASPVVYTLSATFDRQSIMMGSSPRFDMYGCDFGWGRAVALRSGSANKFDGKVSAYPGREGGGSIDLEVCLPPEGMSALEADEEFIDAVSPAGWELPHVPGKLL